MRIRPAVRGAALLRAVINSGRVARARHARVTLVGDSPVRPPFSASLVLSTVKPGSHASLRLRPLPAHVYTYTNDLRCTRPVFCVRRANGRHLRSAGRTIRASHENSALCGQTGVFFGVSTISPDSKAEEMY